MNVMPDNAIKAMADRLREAAREIDADGTPSQVGPTEGECRRAADMLEMLGREQDRQRQALERLASSEAFAFGGMPDLETQARMEFAASILHGVGIADAEAGAEATAVETFSTSNEARKMNTPDQ
jgi:hypothetical protein